MMSKRFKKLPNDSKELTAETIDKVLNTIKANCTTKFDESVDLSFRINNNLFNFFFMFHCFRSSFISNFFPFI